jgi:integrase
VPTFQEVSTAYLAELQAIRAKKPGTIKREASGVKKLNEYLGERPINKVVMKDTFGFAKWRMAGGKVGGRAVDVDIIALRHVMGMAVREGYITANPIQEWENLADTPEKSRLVEKVEIEAMCAAAVRYVQYGQRFADYLKLLQASGGREQETLALKWSVSVDWKRKQLGFGQGETVEDTKFSSARWMPMNPTLEAHLTDMLARRPKDKAGNDLSDCLFPSRMGGGKTRILSYKKALDIVKAKSQVTDFGFHHLRHYFISHAVMSKIDYKTIAEWVGHKDGGVLIGKIYSHLNDAHSTAQAALVNLG